MKERFFFTAQNVYRHLLIPIVLLLLFIIKAQGGYCAVEIAGSSIEGRWNITLIENGKEVPSWLEIVHSGTHRLVGRFVGSGGSARPVSKVNFIAGKMSFTIPPQWEKEDNDLYFEATLQGDSLTGTMKAANGNTYNWTAKRAPLLKREKPVVWEKPVSLFNGKNTDGWHATGENQWIAANGILQSPRSGSNLITDKIFTDFKLHIEFRYPKGSNSGVYLRGRYEVQVEDGKGKQPQSDLFGGIYGFISPNEMVAKDAGEWQSYDITLTGRLVTVIANGKTIICSQEIPGITGGAIDSKEAEPGPIMIQGDHGPIEYRNIIITPAK